MKPKPLNICRIADNFPLPWIGVAPATYYLSEIQHSNGNNVHVIAKYKNGCRRFDRECPFPVHRIKGKLMLFELMTFIKLMKLNRIHQFDLIHSHGTSFFFMHVMRKIFPKISILSIPIVVSVHNIRSNQDQTYELADFFSIAENILGRNLSHLRRQKKKMLNGHRWPTIKQKISYKDADYLMPVSDYLGTVLNKNYDIPKKKIKVIYNGVTDSFFEQVNSTRNNGRQAAKTIIFVGRTIGTKNEASLLKAFSIVKKSHHNTQLIIIGNGYWNKTLHRIAGKLNIADSVRFIEYVEHGKMIKLYESSDIFVFPSFSEGMPKAVLEAMASGLPVVGTDVSGVNELIKNGENGFLSKPNDPGALSNNIMKLLEEPQIAERFSDKNREIVREKFTWSKVAERCDQGYETLLNR